MLHEWDERKQDLPLNKLSLSTNPHYIIRFGDDAKAAITIDQD